MLQLKTFIYFNYKAYFLVLALLICQLGAFAQTTIADREPEFTFTKGVELYQGGFFAASQKTFKEYLNQSHTTESNRIISEYYIAVSAVELFQNDAEILLLRFLTEHGDHPNSRYVYYHLGKFYFRNNQFEKSAIYFDKVEPDLLDEEKLAEYYVMAGYVNFKIENNDKASQFFQRAKNTPGELQAFAGFYYGYTAYKNEKYNEALAEFEKLRDNKKFKTQIPIYIAQIYLLQKKYDKVIIYAKEALNDPQAEKRDEIKLMLAEAYYLTKQYNLTAETFSTYTGNITDNLLYEYGYSLYVLKDWAGVINTFSQINIKPDSLGQNVAYHLGNAYLNVKDKLKARNAFLFASQHNFDKSIREISLFNISKLDYESGDTKLAIDEIRQFLKDFPNSGRKTEAQVLLSQILAAADNPKEAYEILKDIPDKNKDLQESYQSIAYKLGVEYFKNQQFDEAAEYFKIAIQYSIDKKIRAKAIFSLGEIALRKEDTDEAITRFKSFLSTEEAKGTPYFFTAYYNLGFIYFKKQNYTIAAEYYQKYLAGENNAKSKRALDAQLRLADCYFVNKNYAIALSTYDIVINGNSTESDYALYQKSMIYDITDKIDKEIATLRVLVTKYPKSALLDDALFAIAEAYNNNGDYKMAIKEFESLNYNYPKNPYYRQALLLTGQAYYNLDEENKAKFIFNTLIQKYPFSEEAKLAYRYLETIIVESGNTDELDSLKSNVPKNGFVAQRSDTTFYNTAYNNYIKDNCEAAIKSFKTYLTKFPNAYFYADAYYYMAQCEINKNQRLAALEHLNIVLARTPNKYVEQSLKQSAAIYYQDKNYELAAARYEQLEGITNSSDNTKLALTWQIRSFWEIKRYDKVQIAATKIINNPSLELSLRREALLYKSKAEFELNEIEKAQPGFTQLSTDDKTAIGAEATYYKALILFQKDDLKAAETAITYLNSNFKIYDLWRAKGLIILADIYIKNGDSFQAKAILESIADKYKGADAEIIKQEANKRLELLKK